MLDAKTIALIKSTVPVLETRGREITTRFYQLMFRHHPELLHIFNHVNQKRGRQQTALAHAVYAAAVHIDRLEEILPVVRQIAHKHRSIGVLPEHYPIVGKHLLLAIKDVLGDAATDEMLKAWEKAYQVIADVFIRVEQEMYEQVKRQTGGWEGFRDFVVVRKVKESDVITSFYLQPTDGDPIALYLPGQYISVKLEIPGETYTHIRQYSLSDRPGKPYYRISVKREDAAANKPAGMVSSFLHASVREGDVLPISAPAGDFTLDLASDLPLVLISGGVGFTPLLSMLHTVVEEQPTRAVTYIHAAVNGRVHAMRNEVAELAQNHLQLKTYFCYSSPTEEDKAAANYDKAGHLDLAWLQSILSDKQAQFYICGPIPFMQTVYAALQRWGAADEQIRYEFFGPASTLKRHSA
ncbi:NO-inducible flavohemoprotein [Brevibacillus marinus]|uniref:NO-inducible flavohemoprotein n=1 Tax=Brevibacillus marinus TaxID=2496837 RepID=UPI000F8270AA|nr:NO-inducible flavohemoprotein [Brevibacillus marinus]